MPKNFLSLRAVHKVQPCVAVYCRTVPYGALPYRCLPYRQLYVTVLYGTALASNMNISKKLSFKIIVECYRAMLLDAALKFSSEIRAC